MLTLIVYGLNCGAGDVKAIWEKCGPLDQNQRRAIGLTRRNKKTGLLTMPGYGALNDIVNREVFETLNAGFHHHTGKAYAALRLLKTHPPQIN